MRRAFKGFVWLASVSLSAQTIGEVRLGFLFDRDTRVVEPILGLPGDSRIEAPVGQVSAELEPGAYSVQHGVMLARESGGGWSVFAVGTGGALERIPLAVSARYDHAALSAASTTAVIYEEASGDAVLVTGLPSAPRVSWEFRLPPSPLSAKRIVAVGDHGPSVAATANGQTVYIYPGLGLIRVLPVIGTPDDMKFLPGQMDLVIADMDRGVYLIRNLLRRPVLEPLSADLTGLEGQRSITTAASGPRVVVSTRGSNEVVVVDTDSGGAERVSCPCDVLSPAAVRTGPVFLMNQADRGPLWLLDVRSGNAKWVFVPARRAEEGGAAQLEITTPSVEVKAPAEVFARMQFRVDVRSIGDVPARIRLAFLPDEPGQPGSGPRFATGGETAEPVSGDATLDVQAGSAPGRIVFSQESVRLAEVIVRSSDAAPGLHFEHLSGNLATGRAEYEFVYDSTSDAVIDRGATQFRAEFSVVTGTTTQIRCPTCLIQQNPYVLDLSARLEAFRAGRQGSLPYRLRVPVTVEGGPPDIRSVSARFIEGAVQTVCESAGRLEFTCQRR